MHAWNFGTTLIESGGFILKNLFVPDIPNAIRRQYMMKISIKLNGACSFSLMSSEASRTDSIFVPLAMNRWSGQRSGTGRQKAQDAASVQERLAPFSSLRKAEQDDPHNPELAGAPNQHHTL